MDYSFYKIIHFIGISLLLLGLGQTLCAFSSSASPALKIKLPAFFAHGTGLILIVFSGFGLMAKINASGSWIYGKIIIWIFFGLAISLAKRRIGGNLFLVTLFSAMVGIAAYLAHFKPV